MRSVFTRTIAVLCLVLFASGERSLVVKAKTMNFHVWGSEQAGRQLPRHFCLDGIVSIGTVFFSVLVCHLAFFFDPKTLIWCNAIKTLFGSANLGAFTSVDASDNPGVLLVSVQYFWRCTNARAGMNGTAASSMLSAIVSTIGIPSVAVAYFNSSTAWTLPQSWCAACRSAAGSVPARLHAGIRRIRPAS